MQLDNNQLSDLEFVSFDIIKELARKNLNTLTKEKKDLLYKELQRGTAVLDTEVHLDQYLFSFGNMHQKKLIEAFTKLPMHLFNKPFRVIDWGCGQAMGIINLFDYIKDNSLDNLIKEVILIEPSEKAIVRAESYVKTYATKLNKEIKVKCINKYFDLIDSEELDGEEYFPTLHIFSNILDVTAIDLKKLAILVDNSIYEDSFILCVGPLNPTNKRIDHFFNYFKKEDILSIYEVDDAHFGEKYNTSWTNKCRIYQFNKNANGHLVLLEYYPFVEFSSAYELDCIRKVRFEIEGSKKILDQYNNFNVSALFDIGASSYDNVNPILAVLNNLIIRGLPTKTSPFIEQTFIKAFDLTESIGNTDWEIQFGFKEDLFFDLSNLIDSYLVKKELNELELQYLQLVFSPIAISRFQKVLIETLILNRLDLNQEVWHFLVEEKDVPFASIAIDDFKQMFTSLVELTSEYNTLRLPRIELTVLNESIFKNSGLHQTAVSELNNTIYLKKYDLVFTHSIFSTELGELDKFSKFQAKKDCYFNVITSLNRVDQRLIYTTDILKYQPLVTKEKNGAFEEIVENKEKLVYFVQLLFRKVAFRAGQLPILDRALQSKPVIGLLPTGGGKSLTYQLAAMLQPGITIVIDPLKSLMIDQVEGLLENGIDTVSFINSTLSAKEKRTVEQQLESSKLHVVFVSPERLAIHQFRTRLSNMFDYNVYFAYGIIDEVHCVSEWGHDFRFSYLHLGRNLYNYVKAKEGVISLFGLTATASFDVLADVERELSGAGAFELDSDTVVRYENTNRLELQYKIERVSVHFKDSNVSKLDAGLPRPVDLYDLKDLGESKQRFLYDYVSEIPKYVNELQQDKNLLLIKANFQERQIDSVGITADITVDFSNNYYDKEEIYDQSGIVFCPHVKTTYLSVEKNKQNISSKIVDVASFTGSDNDDVSIASLKSFKQNRNPLMIATKAFGMGIDKPNVRFTVNMNYSSSLESFVQEAGRAGRDKRMALATILVSDYELEQVRDDYSENTFPLGVIKGKWFRKGDLKKVLNFYNIDIPQSFILSANPEKDIARITCRTDTKMFKQSTGCNEYCTSFIGCDLKKVPVNYRNTWRSSIELINTLRDKEGVILAKKHLEYLNPDYGAIMYFYNLSFKGSTVEKRFLHNLLSVSHLTLESEAGQEIIGFLKTVVEAKDNEVVIVYIPYLEDIKEKGVSSNYVDICKAIYRMCCIELVEDFTQDYVNKQFRIEARRKSEGAYYEGLRRFLLRYYSEDRASDEIEKAKETTVDESINNGITGEIYKCLSYLTSFVYEKISEKRKRAMDDMRNFCVEGMSLGTNWVETNESLKDYLYYYFNSKYARPDYVAENAEPYSLVVDTDGGKVSDKVILEKYLNVIDDEIVGVGTPLDNVRHLYGAVRLVSRSLTDSNPTLSLLDAFCLAYLGLKNNERLRDMFVERYREGLIGFIERTEDQVVFWDLFNNYHKIISRYIDSKLAIELKEYISINIHAKQVELIMKQYLK